MKNIPNTDPVPDCRPSRNDNRKLTICDNRILTTLSTDNIWDDKGIIPDIDVTVG
jgi:hypothetical protein